MITDGEHLYFRVGDKVRPNCVSDGVITKLLPNGRVEIQTELDGLQEEDVESLLFLERLQRSLTV